MNRTCFHEMNVAAGAKMVEMFGYELPWAFAAGGEAEHVAARENVACVDLGYMAHFTVSGPDALAFLQTLLTADVGQLRPGRIMYTAICDQNGLMIDDATIWAHGDGGFMLITGDEADERWINAQAKHFKNVSVSNVTHGIGVLQVQGPRAGAHMKKVTGLDPAAIKYYNFLEMDIDGHKVTAAKMSFTGAGGFEYHVDVKDAEWLWNTLTEAGREFGMLPIGQCALESLRQEGGYPLVGNEHARNVNPLELGIAQVVKFRKPAFNGRSALLDAVRKGVEKRIVWLKLAGRNEPKTGDAIMLEGRQVGTVTSGSYSGTFKTAIAVGYVQVGRIFPGLAYSVISGPAEHQARLSLVPLYDPTHEIRRK